MPDVPQLVGRPIGNVGGGGLALAIKPPEAHDPVRILGLFDKTFIGMSGRETSGLWAGIFWAGCFGLLGRTGGGQAKAGLAIWPGDNL